MTLLSPGLRARADAMSEAQLLDAVAAALELHHWLWSHFRPALKSDGTYVTPLQGHKGLPDIIAARGGVVIMAELKSERGKPTAEQRAWLEASGAYLWRPSDWLGGVVDDVIR